MPAPLAAINELETIGHSAYNSPQKSLVGILTNTKNATNAPGIGSGEPFNMQLAAKLIF